MKASQATLNAGESLSALGFTLSILNGPVGVFEDKWPCIRYRVKLEFKGRAVLETDYSLGIGHVSIKNARPDSILNHWTEDERSMLYAWQAKPGANFINKTLQASVAAKLAKQQKVAPSLADVLHSLLMDGEAFFNAQSFEDWATGLGYDPDSRKAEAIYRQCDLTGRKLAQNVPSGVLAQARGILADY